MPKSNLSLMTLGVEPAQLFRWIKLPLLLLAAVSIASANPAEGASFKCTPVNQNVITNGANSPNQMATCTNITASPGNIIRGIAVAIIGSWQDAITGTNHQIRFTATNNYNSAAVVADTAIADLTGTTGRVQGMWVDIQGTSAIPSITVTVNAATLGALGLPDNASFTVFIETVEEQQEECR